MSRNLNHKVFDENHLPETSILRSIYEFAVPSFVETYREGYPLETLQKYAQEHFAHHRLFKELKNGDCLLLTALDHEKCLGFVYVKKQSVPQIALPEACPEIQRFYVRAETRGSGAGSALLAAMENELLRRKHHGVWLDVWKFNIYARRFYERHAYESVGQVVYDFPGETEANDLIMYKNLSQNAHRRKGISTSLSS